MRVCYHIQSHTLPAQLVRLIRTIRTSSPDCLVVVSHSMTGPELELGERADDPAVIVLRVPNGYGDFSHVDRWLEVVDLLVERGADFDWLCNLSGQDYPLVPLAQAERELRDSGADGFLQLYPVFTQGGKWPRSKGLTRYAFRYARLPLPPGVRRLLRPLGAVNRVQPLIRVNAAYGAVGVRRRVPIPLPEFWGGSFFCSLSRECVLHVRDWVRRNPALVRYFRGVLAPEEVFFQTVLRGAGRFTLIADSKRYFDFRESKGNHPKVLRVADLPRMESRGAHFARKLDERVDPDLIDLLDQRILGVEHTA